MRYTNTIPFFVFLGKELPTSFLISPSLASAKRFFFFNFFDQLKVWLARLLVSWFFFRLKSRETISHGRRERVSLQCSTK